MGFFSFFQKGTTHALVLTRRFFCNLFTHLKLFDIGL